jgi:rhodanese-related sulfurtransferase
MTVEELLEEARARLVRLEPHAAARARQQGALLVDIRPPAQRERDGTIPHALVIDRNVLEWRLDPASPSRIPELTDRQHVVILICEGGYASSLAAASLLSLGLVHATDVVGGVQAWKRAHLPITH